MDIDSFLTQLETDIADTVVNDCKQVVEEKFHNNSNKIYDEYIPWSSYGKQYKRRRENGGYGDKDNISTQIINNGNGDITLLTSNDTKGVGDAKNNYIDEIIEEGGDKNYTWMHENGSGKAGIGYPDDFPLPRPVSEWTMDELNETNIIENTIEKSLKAKGYNVK